MTTTSKVPTCIKDIPKHKLSEAERWSLARQLWSELLFPILLSQQVASTADEVVPKHIVTLQRCQEVFAQAKAEGSDAAAVRDCFSVVCCPWQRAPFTREQLNLLRHMFEPEDAPEHLQVISELSHATWKTLFKKTMAYTIAEVQHGPKVQESMQALSQRGLGLDDAWKSAWETIMSTWDKWSTVFRPHVLAELRENMKAHITARLGGISDAAPERVAGECEELVRLCTWLEGGDRTSEAWRRLHNDAKQALLKATEADRWTSLATLVRSLSDKSEWDEHLDDLVSKCEACEGLAGNAEDAKIFPALAEKILKSDRMTLERARLAENLLAFVKVGDASELADNADATTTKLLRQAAHVCRLAQTIGLGCTSDPDNVPENVLVAHAEYIKAEKMFSESCSAASVDKTNLVTKWETMESCVEKFVTKRKQASEAKVMKLLKEATDAIAKLSARCVEVAWKGKVADNAPWADIVREVEYAFWKGNGSMKVTDELDGLYCTSSRAWEAYEKEVQRLQGQVDTKAKGEWEQTGTFAMVLCTEEYMVRQIEEKGDQAEKKLSRRLFCAKQGCLQSMGGS